DGPDPWARAQSRHTDSPWLWADPGPKALLVFAHLDINAIGIEALQQLYRPITGWSIRIVHQQNAVAHRGAIDANIKIRMCARNRADCFQRDRFYATFPFQHKPAGQIG